MYSITEVDFEIDFEFSPHLLSQTVDPQGTHNKISIRNINSLRFRVIKIKAGMIQLFPRLDQSAYQDIAAPFSLFPIVN